MTDSARPVVEFWFDPICPWTWITSRWVVEVSAARGFEVQWHPFSLAILNEGNDPGDHAEAQRQGHRFGLVLTAVRAAHGVPATGALYTALGERLHPEVRQDYDAVLAEALEQAQLPVALAALEPTAELEAELRASTRRGIERVGPGVGIPIISIDGTAFFGPVISPAPRGAEALQLWDGVLAAASIPGFFELKRGREVGPVFD